MNWYDGHHARPTSIKVWTFLAVAGIAACLVAIAPDSGFSGNGKHGSLTVASDSFARVVAKGWGRADAGGFYRHSTRSAALRVDGSVGLMTFAKADAFATADLSNTVIRDVDVSFRVATDKHIERQLTDGSGLRPSLKARHGISRQRAVCRRRPGLRISPSRDGRTAERHHTRGRSYRT